MKLINIFTAHKKLALIGLIALSILILGLALLQPTQGSLAQSSTGTAAVPTAAVSGTPRKILIMGKITSPSGGLPGVNVAAAGGGPSTTTDSTGVYKLWVPYGSSGTVIPSKAGYVCDPLARTYTNLTSDQIDQDYYCTPYTPTPTRTSTLTSTPTRTRTPTFTNTPTRSPTVGSSTTPGSTITAVSPTYSPAP